MPSGLLTQAVAELHPLPQIDGPKADVAAPEGNIVDDPEVLAASARTVRVTGIACGYGVEGSGWVAGRDLVVTNAHVVAGEASDVGCRSGARGQQLPAEVVVFDERNDMAVLRVDGLGLEPLPLAAPRPGEAAAVVGFPENGPLDIEPARTGATQRVISSDAYNRGPVERVVTSFRVYVRPGNSGGPAVDADGRVVSTIFASRTDSDDSGYGIPPRIIQRHLKAAASRSPRQHRRMRQLEHAPACGLRFQHVQPSASTCQHASGHGPRCRNARLGSLPAGASPACRTAASDSARA